jgi:hypothetical protein
VRAGPVWYHLPLSAENEELSAAMYLANLHGQKDQEAANVSAAFVVGMAAMIGTLATWPWSMVSAFAAIAALAVVAHVNILRPLLRRKKSEKPVKTRCLIPSTRHHECDFAEQDAEEHIVETITLPSNSEAVVDFWFQPRLFFSTNEINLGCEGDRAKIPYATQYFNRFIEEGEGKQIVPGPGNRHYIDKHHFYHLREGPRVWSRGSVVAMAFKFKTKAPGRYQFEDDPKSTMRCVSKKHRRNHVQLAFGPRAPGPGGNKPAT